VYQYDYAGRLTLIRHEQGGEELLLELAYQYTPDGLISEIDETTADDWAATMFTYDNRNRLIDEERINAHPYHLSYTYDQGGNRLTKTDRVAETTTTYHYDVQEPTTYLTNNNRLMWYEVKDGGDELIETVSYFYGDAGAAAGNPTLIVRKPAGEDTYYGTTLQYNRQGELWFAIQQTWDDDGQGNPDCRSQSHEVQRITEFHGSGRARDMARERNPTNPPNVLAATAVWSDYDDDVIHSDYVVGVTSGLVTEKTAYVPGLGEIDDPTSAARYHHTDHLGTLRALTDEQSAASGTMVHTAFGDPVYANGTVGTRYQYAGASGYETGLLPAGSGIPGLPWQHVGYRWYNPTTGRFLQRDPVSIFGGLNVYQYVFARPTGGVDPLGFAMGDYILKYSPLYFAGCWVSKNVIYPILGETYPGHPHEIIWGIVQDQVYVISGGANPPPQPPRPQIPTVGPPAPPPEFDPVHTPDVPCGYHY
jgi:RHS repeat-associated protein